MCVNKSEAAFSLQDEVFGYNCPAAAAAGCSHLHPSQQLSQVLISFVILLNIRLTSQTSYDINDFPRSLSILYTRADLRGGRANWAKGASTKKQLKNVNIKTGNIKILFETDNRE